MKKYLHTEAGLSIEHYWKNTFLTETNKYVKL
jgi:hypothetical protein